MSEISDRYRARASAFEDKVRGVRPGQWSAPSPCAEWDARGVVRHIIAMHAAMLSPLKRAPRPAPSVDDEPVGAYQAARADVEAVLDDVDLAGQEVDTPVGRMTAAEHIDQVVSDDLVLHGWDLARATGQDDTIDPGDLDRIWKANAAIPPETLEMMRTPEAFGPGIVVFGPEVPVPEDAPAQDRLLGLIGRDPQWTAAP